MAGVDDARIAVGVTDGVSNRRTTRHLSLRKSWTVSFAAKAVAAKFEHNLHDNSGTEYDYRLSWNNTFLEPDVTLESAGVTPGAELVLTYNPTAAEERE